MARGDYPEMYERDYFDDYYAREEGAGEAAEHGPQREGRELGGGDVDAERPAGDLVLPQRLPGAAEWLAAQAELSWAASHS